MLDAVLILIFSAGLFCFYIQTLCEKILKHEFDRAYFRDIISAIQLEFPHLRESLSADAPLEISEIKLALKTDFATLAYFLKNSDRARPYLSREQKVIVLYFRFLLLTLPARHALHLGSRSAALRLTSILQFFANSIGEQIGASQSGLATERTL